MASKIGGDNEARPFTQAPLLAQSELGKIRHLAGWVLHKEQTAAANYITRNAGSTRKSVLEKFSFEMEVMKVLKGMSGSYDRVIQLTDFQDTLEHTERYNRGGLTHVYDDVFLFFVKLESCCQQVFKTNIVMQYRSEAVRFARKVIREDATVKMAWQSMIIAFNENKGKHISDAAAFFKQLPRGETEKGEESFYALLVLQFGQTY